MKIIIKVLLIIITICITINSKFVYAQRGCCSHHGGVSGACSNGKQVCNDGSVSPSCTCSGGSSNSYSEITSTARNIIPNIVYGCTDRNSINYNSSANRDDGSCIPIVKGCTDPEAYNYNSNANTNDGSCIAKVYGCIDKKADNYNKKANTTDGSCLYTTTKTEYKKINYKTNKKFKLFTKAGSILQKGKKGKKKIVYEITKDEKGNIVKKKKIETTIIKQPINKIIAS